MKSNDDRQQLYVNSIEPMKPQLVCLSCNATFKKNSSLKSHITQKMREDSTHDGIREMSKLELDLNESFVNGLAKEVHNSIFKLTFRMTLSLK
jgi:hypothetical protein